MASAITVPAANSRRNSAFKGKALRVRAAVPLATRVPMGMTRCSALAAGGGLMASTSALPVLVACAAIPTCLGFWKQEYAVSYGYAGAMASSGLAALVGGGLEPLALVHASLFLLYGVRLGAFLLWRELSFDRFRKFTEKIEERAPAQRLKRFPWVATCSLLYLGMVAPLVITSRQAATLSGGPLATAQVSLVAAAIGGLIEAVGDLQKSYYKGQDPSKWVDKGLFSVLRHPNYQGEQLLWAGSMAAAVSCAWGALSTMWAWVIGGLLGTAGIQMVLVMATTGLERRQGDSYGDDPTFETYRASTWGGFTLPSKQGGSDVPKGAASEASISDRIDDRRAWIASWKSRTGRA